MLLGIYLIPVVCVAVCSASSVQSDPDYQAYEVVVVSDPDPVLFPIQPPSTDTGTWLERKRDRAAVLVGGGSDDDDNDSVWSATATSHHHCVSQCMEKAGGDGADAGTTKKCVVANYNVDNGTCTMSNQTSGILTLAPRSIAFVTRGLRFLDGKNYHVI